MSVVKAWFERRESRDPWRGRQPKYDKLVRLGPNRFELLTKLPSGKPISVRLSRFRGRFSEPS